MKRKTIEVSKIKDYVNYILKQNNITQLEKRGYCSLLMYILRESGNYEGYYCINENEYDRKYL